MTPDQALLVWCTALCVCAAMVGIVRLHTRTKPTLFEVLDQVNCQVCYHKDAIAVESLPVLDQPAELVAWWCAACETQLPAGFKALEPPKVVAQVEKNWDALKAAVAVAPQHRVVLEEISAEVYAVGQPKPIRVIHTRNERYDRGGWVR